MTRTTVTKSIAAPVDLVFKTVANINNYSKAVSDIINVEFLSEVQTGIGARFRETRLRNGKKAETELEVTEYVENDHVRMVADSHGTVWDSTFTVKETGDHTHLMLIMDANAHTLLSTIMNPLMKSILRKGVEKDMDAVKAFCEK